MNFLIRLRYMLYLTYLRQITTMIVENIFMIASFLSSLFFLRKKRTKEYQKIRYNDNKNKASYICFLFLSLFF